MVSRGTFLRRTFAFAVALLVIGGVPALAESVFIGNGLDFTVPVFRMDVTPGSPTYGSLTAVAGQSSGFAADNAAGRIYFNDSSFEISTRSLSEPNTVIGANFYDTPGTYIDMTFDGAAVWVVDHDLNALSQVDPLTGVVTQSVIALGFIPVGVAWDGVGFWVSQEAIVDDTGVTPAPIHYIVGGIEDPLMAFLPMAGPLTPIVSGGLGYNPATRNLWIGSDSGMVYDYDLPSLANPSGVVAQAFALPDARFVDGLEYVTPEPATFGMLGVALLVLGAALRRRLS